MNAAHPQISIIIPTYNRKSYLDRALKSVWDQTESSYEVIVIDDGSTDGTTEWLHQFHPQVQVIQSSTNQGAAARNSGITQANGRWIAFLDSDDQWLPDYLEFQTQALKQHPKSVLAYCDYIRVFSPEEPGIETAVQPSHDDLILSLLIRCFIHTLSQVVLPRFVFEKVGLLDERLRGCHDWEFYLRLFTFGSPIHVPRYLMRKHWLSDSIVTQSNCQDWLANGSRVFDIFYSRPENARYAHLRPALEKNFRARVENTRQYFLQEFRERSK